MTPDAAAPGRALHVAFYMHDFSSGGVERTRIALISVLRARGVRVSLVVGSMRGKLASLLPNDLPVVELKTQRTWKAIPRLRAFLCAAQPDVLISSLDHNNIAAMIARLLPGTDTRLIVCQHNAVSAERILGWKYRIVPLAYRLLHGSAEAVIAVSRGVADELCCVAGIPRGKISVIYNPVVGAGFAARCGAQPPDIWFECRGAPVFVFVGRLTAQKDPLTLLQAMRLLLDRQPARLILVGEGELEARLRHYARQAGISHAVKFAGFQANPLPWIAHADALVSASRYEGFGNAIAEALACGTQIIATDCPHGPSEILLEGALGTLVPVGDASALADAMAGIAAARVDAAKLQARAASFTAAACAEAHLKLLRRIMLERHGSIRALGMDISPLSAAQVAETICSQACTGHPRLVVTPNIHHVGLLRRREFAAAYAAAYLVCPDGFPVLLYAQLCGLRLRARVTGCEIFNLVVRHPDLVRHKILVVVESEATACAARAWSEQRQLSRQMSFAVAPATLEADAAAQAALLRMVAEAAPTILVMTLGAPVSEVFVHRHAHALPPCWALCVGQALRVELGLALRAPSILRRLGLEWLWRLCCEPQRLIGRYAGALAWFPVAVLRDFSSRGQWLPARLFAR